jgi:hypothetical protein
MSAARVDALTPIAKTWTITSNTSLKTETHALQQENQRLLQSIRAGVANE